MAINVYLFVTRQSGKSDQGKRRQLHSIRRALLRTPERQQNLPHSDTATLIAQPSNVGSPMQRRAL